MSDISGQKVAWEVRESCNLPIKCSVMQFILPRGGHLIQNVRKVLRASGSTLWGIRSVMMFFVFLGKFRLPIELDHSCSISPTATAGGTCKKSFTKHRY